VRPFARRRRSLGLLLAMLVVVATAGQAGATGAPGDGQETRAGTAGQGAARPQVAEPENLRLPDYACAERYLGLLYYQPVATNTSDYIIWQCVHTPIFKYWWKIKRIGNQQEDEERGDYKWLKFGAEGVWQGIVQSGFAVIDVDGNPSNDNLDSVASFDLRGPSGVRSTGPWPPGCWLPSPRTAGHGMPAPTPVGSRLPRTPTSGRRSCSTATGPSAARDAIRRGPPVASCRSPPASG
jgi:hypothetical protein